ncbi:MAG: hypothetical protein ACE5GR_09005, partial [Nitrosopumilus sp.]
LYHLIYKMVKNRWFLHGHVFSKNNLNYEYFYMDIYYRLSEEKKRQMYLDAEFYLTLSDFETVEKNIKELTTKNTQLEEKFNDLLQYLRTNNISANPLSYL